MSAPWQQANPVAVGTLYVEIDCPCCSKPVSVQIGWGARTGPIAEATHKGEAAELAWADYPDYDAGERD